MHHLRGAEVLHYPSALLYSELATHMSMGSVQSCEYCSHSVFCSDSQTKGRLVIVTQTHNVYLPIVVRRI